MKKVLQLTLGIVVLGSMLTMHSCNAIKDKIVQNQSIDFDGASADLILPATNDTTAQGTMGQTELSYDLDAMIKEKTKGALTYKNINTVKIKTITLSLDSATSTSNFANFVYASATFNTDANGGGYDPYNIGYVENNPDTYSTSISPKVTDADQDVKKYFNSKMVFTYAVIAKLRRATKTDLKCHVAITYTIELK